MGQRARILVVDDSVDIRESDQMVLESVGFEVLTASDGEQGFAMARRWRPDVIILDVVMPGMDGLELLLKLRSDLVPPIPPVILCSGFDLTEEEALRRGAARFLRKPMELTDLLDAVDDALAGRAVPAEIVQQQHHHASAAREQARNAARDLIRRIEAHGAPSLAALQARARTKVTTLAGYTGIARVALAIVRDDKLVVLAAADEAALESGFDLGTALPQAYDVLETGSELLLPDASLHPFSSVSRTLGGIRFFAGVPLLLDGGVPVGVVCQFDTQARRIDSDGLVALRLFGRRGSAALVRFAESGDAAPTVADGYGIIFASLFEELLDAELRMLARHGGSMEIAVVDASDVAAVSDAMARAPSRERLIAARMANTRLALFKRAADDSAGHQLASLVAHLRALETVHEAGVVDVSGRLRGLNARDLLHVAGIELDRAVERGDEVRRVLIEERAT